MSRKGGKTWLTDIQEFQRLITDLNCTPLSGVSLVWRQSTAELYVSMVHIDLAHHPEQGS